ncbi:Hsp20 family protein [Wolbachia endosymbiont of Kerria lacca]|uniref:Hsp20 family protein n=1 Tax=Wolbachia endosymbiont of Kerria lacca TaxID=427705 RepID=UPI003F675DE5
MITSQKISSFIIEKDTKALSIVLPVNVEQDKVSANFSDGVLHSTISKSEKYIKKIDVKVN